MIPLEPMRCERTLVLGLLAGVVDDNHTHVEDDVSGQTEENHVLLMSFMPLLPSVPENAWTHELVTLSV